MIRLLLPCSAALVACSPSPQEAAIRSPDSPGSAGPPARAAPEPSSAPVSAAAEPASTPRASLSPEAEGRRILSTAFVRVGPDGHLTVERYDGRVLVLRDVVMGPEGYCGVRAGGGPGKSRYCGGYAEVALARPGGGSAPLVPDEATSHPAAQDRERR